MGGYDLVKYSIIVPVYNVKKYLNECIRSILDQKYFDLEILLIDDDSTAVSYTHLDVYKRQEYLSLMMLLLIKTQRSFLLYYANLQ